MSLTVLANQLAFFVRFEYILHYLLRFVKRANVCTVPVVVICCILVHLSLFLMHLMCMRVPYFCRFFVIVHLTRCVLNSFSLTEISQWHQSAPDVEEPKPLSRPALILQKGCVHKLHVQNIGCHNCWVLTQIIAMALGGSQWIDAPGTDNHVTSSSVSVMVGLIFIQLVDVRYSVKFYTVG